MAQSLYAYVVVFSGVRTNFLLGHIDHMPDIKNWYRPPLNGTVFVVTDLTAQELGRLLREEVPHIDNLLVLDAETDRSGYLPRSAWHFLRNPRRAQSGD